MRTRRQAEEGHSRDAHRRHAHARMGHTGVKVGRWGPRGSRDTKCHDSHMAQMHTRTRTIGSLFSGRVLCREERLRRKTRAHTHAHIYTCISARAQTVLHTHTRMHAHAHAHAHTRTHAHPYHEHQQTHSSSSTPICWHVLYLLSTIRITC